LDPNASGSEPLFGRVVAALLAPRDGAVLVAYQEPLAVVELSNEGTGIAVLDATGAPAEEVRQRLDRIFEAHQTGVLIAVVVGGGSQMREAIVAADRAARNADKLGAYHVDDSGRLARVAGRRQGAVVDAVAALGTTRPLSPEEIGSAMARAQHDREEAVRFAATLQGRRPWATWALLAACVVLFFLARHWGQVGRGATQFAMGANSEELVRSGEIWRLLASAFLHGDDLHLIANMLGLYSFGSFLEVAVGWRRFVLLYATSALGGGLASAFAGHVHSSVGASGAIWGLMTAGLALSLLRRSVFPRRIASGLRSRLVPLVMLNIFLSFIPTIDKWAHGGGGVVGFALAAAGLLSAHPNGDPRWIRVTALVSAMALVVSVVVALAAGQPWS